MPVRLGRRLQPLLRVHLTRALKSGTLSAEQDKAVRRIMNTRLGMRKLAQDAEVAAQTKGVAATLEAEGDHPILKWLWDNRDQILAWVLNILKLFGL